MNASQQIEAIRVMARRRTAQWLKWVLVLASLLFAITGLYTRQTPYFIGSGLAAIIACAAHQAAPHIQAAARALDTGERSPGTVTIEVAGWSDSDKFHARIVMADSGVWRFEFIPLGWKPVAGQYPATIFRLPGLAWPALVQIEAGVMYPRYTPKPAVK